MYIEPTIHVFKVIVHNDNDHDESDEDNNDDMIMTMKGGYPCITPSVTHPSLPLSPLLCILIEQDY